MEYEKPFTSNEKTVQFQLATRICCEGRSPEKSSCSFGFCPIEGGGGPCPNFLSTFHKLYILGQFGDGEGRRDPCPNLLADWRSKKWYKLSKLGGGVEVIWTKSKRTATFFRETVPYPL